MQQPSVSQYLSKLRAQSKKTELTCVKDLEDVWEEILKTLKKADPTILTVPDLDTQENTELESFKRLHTVPARYRSSRFDSSEFSSNRSTPMDLCLLIRAFLKEGNRLATTITTQRVLESLHFRELKEREFNIKESHASTYHWIFAKDGPYKDIKFMNWLERDSDVYWITGKAGSGKSTLMKLISNHPQVRQALGAWADKDTIIIASHFFWHGGHQMQKSQSGLLRSILHQIFRQCPTLIELACPGQWQADEQADVFIHGWSDQALSSAFRRLSEQNQLSVKICIFVDGLDEYGGDYRDILALFQRAGASPNIKLCLSSRPWNVFQNAFGESDDHMILQKYTQNDMREYVSDILSQDSQYKRLAERDRRAQDLQKQITEKANGVFLWVYLVVRSLLSGLTDDNTITELQQRICDIPEDLDDYFQLILTNIEKCYQTQSAHIFLLSVQAMRPQSIVTYSFLEDAIRDADFALDDLQPLTIDQISTMCVKQRKYINARCKDLLEITLSPHVTDIPILTYKVDFLHRTVRDFLSSNAVYEEFERKAAPRFSVRRALFRAHLAQIKASSPPPSVTKSYSSFLSESLIELMYDAYEIETFHKVAETAHLDELERVTSETYNVWQYRKGDLDKRIRETCFLTTAVKARLHLYVVEKLDGDPTLLFEKRRRPLLRRALAPSQRALELFPGVDSYFDLEMARLLLARGADPNERIRKGKGITVWQSFLLNDAGRDLRERENREVHREYQKRVFRVAEMMVEHGADLESRSGWRHRAESLPEVTIPCEPRPLAVTVLKEALQPKDWERLETLIGEKRAIQTEMRVNER